MNNFTDKDIPLIRSISEDKNIMIDSLVNYCLWQMDLDRKTQALKQIQGNIWKKAYETGQIKGQ
jgi:enolase-phosphatase E1